MALSRCGADAVAGGGCEGGMPRAFLACIFPLRARGTFVNPHYAFSRGLLDGEEVWTSYGLPEGMSFSALLLAIK